jgi:hypothetical protein
MKTKTIHSRNTGIVPAVPRTKLNGAAGAAHKQTPAPKVSSSEAMAAIMLDRQERIKACSDAIRAACETNRCAIAHGITIMGDGKVTPQINLVPLD